MFLQVFSENMGKKSEPQVTVCLQGVNWTRTFKPDLVKLNMTHPDNDVAAPHEEKTVPVAFNADGCGSRTCRIMSISISEPLACPLPGTEKKQSKGFMTVSDKHQFKCDI